MTAVSFGVVLLLVLAAVVAGLMVLAATGRLELGMDAPEPWRRRPALRPSAPPSEAADPAAVDRPERPPE
ncbi:hypothetical protein [Brachybacterium phenoliresistens]|uniref:Uncharacterized protein n=1 Tax=Brachybacterium phenoliresistens TaxID=396014 RepID=Z9JRS6_9MICO|nr:hypothetical protein [Brachybacterium phenoliresistens]EWS80733.1 hypothetical protein BF93_02275 [Brachybacterium phenoliresistens]